MMAAQALVTSLLMVPLFAIGQVQMHTRVHAYLRAQAPTSVLPTSEA